MTLAVKSTSHSCRESEFSSQKSTWWLTTICNFSFGDSSFSKSTRNAYKKNYHMHKRKTDRPLKKENNNSIYLFVCVCVGTHVIAHV